MSQYRITDNENRLVVFGFDKNLLGPFIDVFLDPEDDDPVISLSGFETGLTINELVDWIEDHASDGLKKTALFSPITLLHELHKQAGEFEGPKEAVWGLMLHVAGKNQLALDDVDGRVKELAARHAEEMAPLLEERNNLRQAVENLREQFRRVALLRHFATGEQVDLPAVTIIKKKVVTYDEGVVLEWAERDAKYLVKRTLDKTNFRRAVINDKDRAIPEDIYEYEEIPDTRVASDLRPFVKGESPGQPAQDQEHGGQE